MGQFNWSVRVAGGEVRDLVLNDTATIRYGRSTIDVQPEPTNATLTLLTYDAAPSLFDDKPSYILDSENIPSGFVAEWQEHYDGVVTVLELGASVEIDIASNSGFTSQWSEIYLGAVAQSNRFRGHVIAMDYRPGTLTLTAATDQENLGRVMVGGDGRPAQTDAQRVNAISAEAGIPITVEAGEAINLRSLPEFERSAWSALQQVCEDVGGLLYTDREGVVRYRQRGGYEPSHVIIPPLHTLVDPLAMSIDVSRVANTVKVIYGDVDEDGNRPIATAINPDLVTALGVRETEIVTDLADAADAQDRADQRVGITPQWEAGTVTVFLRNGDEGLIGDVANLELGDTVTLPDLLPGGPSPTYTASLLGYTEQLGTDDWQLSLHLEPWFINDDAGKVK